MSNDVAKFGVGLDFTQAMAGLRRMRRELASLNTMQRNLNAPRRGMSGSRNSFSERRDREAEYAREIQHQRDMALARRSPTGSRNPPQSNERRRQEALGRQMAADITANNRLREQGARTALRAEQTRVRALERARTAVRNTTLMQELGATASQRQAQASIRARIATARTADEVRTIVAQERSRLRLMNRQSGVMRRMQQSSHQMMNNMVSAFAVAAGGAYITKTGQDFESVANTMLAVSADSTEAGENLKFVREEAFRLGLGLKESAKGFAKMNAARGDMSLEDTKAAFTGVSEMGTLLGLSSEEGGRAINALMQMMSKGVVSAEELSY